jgi:hypothetical protein
MQVVLTIRQHQMKALAAIHVKHWYVDHLRRHFTKFSSWSSRDLLDFVESGIQGAARYGIRSPKCVSRYLDVMAAHGADFDTREDCRWWAGAVLRQADVGMNEERLSQFLAKSAVTALSSRW